MRRILLGLTLSAVALLGRPLHAEVEAEQVREAIKRGTQYLLREQRPDGSWTGFLKHDLTGLCTLALLQAGVKPEDPAIQKSLVYLRSQPPKETYETALQTMVLCAAEPTKDLLLIRRNAAWFEKTQINSGNNKGAWAYPGRGNGDNSNSQFALLALHEAERAGVSVKDETWRMALAYWQKAQNIDGSFGYQPGGAGSASMTCAGITSLVIASGRLQEGDAGLDGERVRCCADQDSNDQLERALHWLGQNFSVHHNTGGSGLWLLYYLYGVERVGRLTAHRFLGGHDWYREGSEMLVGNQDQLSGYWKGTGHVEDNPYIGTSLSLLFLAKGRRPVLMGRLKHGPAGDEDWNHHRNALSHLTTYVETRWKRDLTWQVIDAPAATVDDLLQAPVLFLNGKDGLKFTDEQAKQLREYVNQGGFILAEACCPHSDAFHQSFEELMSRVFPEPEYRLREIGPEHPVWQAEEKIAPEQLRPLWGIEYGCRTSVIYVPPHPVSNSGPSLSCLWELSRPGREQQLPQGVQEQVAAANALGVNVLAYATNRELKFKDEIPARRETGGTKDAVERARLYIAKLRHGGGWNVAPAALPNLQRALNQEVGLRVSTDLKDVAITDSKLFDHTLVFMHGRHEFRLSDAERKQLRTFLERGGTILADAVCASPAFDRALRSEIAAIFPETSLARIPADHPLFAPKYGGFDLQSVTRRDPQRGDGRAEASLRKVEPELEGLKIGPRYAVVYSPYDLSCALENHESLECKGYIREDAARIGINVVLYSLYGE
jgi:hypothetical protein